MDKLGKCQGKDYSSLLKKYVECSVPGYQRLDPYLFELYGEAKIVCLCDYHFDVRKDDI